MIDFSYRIEELMTFLSNEYGIKDRQGVETILSCQLKVSQYEIGPVWLILETDWHSLIFTHSWFALGGNLLYQPVSLNTMRAGMIRWSEEIIREWMNCKDPRYLVDSAWAARQKRAGQQAIAYPLLLAHSLRVAIPTPKNASVLTPNPIARDQEMRRLVDRVLDTAHRLATRDSARSAQQSKDGKMPPSFLYYCEMFQKLSPYHIDWSILTKSLVDIVRRHAYLYDRPVEKDDWRIAVRVLKDSVPLERAMIVKTINEHKQPKVKSASGMLKATGLSMSPSTMQTLIGDMISRQVVARIPNGYVIKHPDFLGIVEGRALDLDQGITKGW